MIGNEFDLWAAKQFGGRGKALILYTNDMCLKDDECKVVGDAQYLALGIARIIEAYADATGATFMEVLELLGDLRAECAEAFETASGISLTIDKKGD